MFQVGDVVRFNLDEDGLYSYEVPKLGTIGVIDTQSHSIGLEQMLGVKIPVSIVQWENGQKIPVFTHDLIKHKSDDDLIKEIKSIPDYTGLDIN